MSNTIFMLIKNLLDRSNKAKDNINVTLQEKEDIARSSNLLPDYENALSSFGISLSEPCRNRIIEKIKENAAQITAKSETDHMENILVNIIKYNMLDGKTVIDFEKKVFSLKYFWGSSPVPFEINLNTVISEFLKNKNYLSIIIESKRFHSLEFARLMSLYSRAQSNENSLFEEQISDSFYKTKNLYGANSKYVNLAWIRYLSFAASLTSVIPNPLLEYVNSENYKTLFDLLKNYRNKPHENIICDLQEFTVKMCKKIINEINPFDIPALLFLGKVCEENGNYNSAQNYYSRIATDCDCFNGAVSLISSYENEIRQLLNLKYGNVDCKKEDINQKIGSINLKLEEIYNEWETKLQNKLTNCLNKVDKSEVEDQYITLMTKRARHEKDRKNYINAYNILTKIPECLSESYRVYFEFGLLYQTIGTKYKANKYYDLQKSADMLKHAYDIVKEGKSKTAKKSILIPLANTLYMMKNYTEALNVCHNVLEIDKCEKNAYKLMDKINNSAA